MDNISSLYHYTSFETFTKIWLSKKLKFGDVTLLNDMIDAEKPFMTPLSLGGNERITWARELIVPFKQISFTGDFSSSLKGSMSLYMWAHYGDKRKGVCIEFDFEKLKFEKSMLHDVVGYNERLEFPFSIPHNLKSKEEIKEFLLENQKQLFFTKSTDFQGENEYRVLSDQSDWLDISDAIKSVCVTDPFGDVSDFLISLLPETIPISYFGYHSRGGYYVPMIGDVKLRRQQRELNSN